MSDCKKCVNKDICIHAETWLDNFEIIDGSNKMGIFKVSLTFECKLYKEVADANKGTD